MWKLEAGLRIVRALQQPIRAYGYHLAIGGGVVNKGESEKDLDLYFLPMGGFDKEKKRHEAAKLLAFLSSLWGAPEDIRRDYEDEEDDDNKMLYEHAVKFTRPLNQRIDCFIF